MIYRSQGKVIFSQGGHPTSTYWRLHIRAVYLLEGGSLCRRVSDQGATVQGVSVLGFFAGAAVSGCRPPGRYTSYRKSFLFLRCSYGKCKICAYCDKIICFLYKYCSSNTNGGSSNTQLTLLIEQMNATINSQQTMIALLQNQISNLQTTTSQQQTLIDNFNVTINDHGTSISTHDTEINALQEKDGSYESLTYNFPYVCPVQQIYFFHNSFSLFYIHNFIIRRIQQKIITINSET